MSDIRENAYGDNFDLSDRTQEKIDRVLFEADFESISLQQDDRLRFPRPIPIQDFIDTLVRQHILILAGDPGINKNDLAVYIAWELNHHISQGIHHQVRAPEVLQWTRRCEADLLLTRISETPATTPSIFFLPHIATHFFERKHLDQLIHQSKQHYYIIISTESTLGDWQLREDARQLFWKDLQPKGLFNPNDLAEAMIERILEKQSYLPEGIRIDDLSPDKPLCQRITPREIVQMLGTVNHIQWFICSLFVVKQPIDDVIITNLINRACRSDTLAPDEAFNTWYQALDQRRQLLALNVGIFESLNDSQFFAAMERLFKRIWRFRDPNLRAYDYDDLDSLEPFCSQTTTTYGGRIIQMQLPGNQQDIEQQWRSERQLLLQTAWKTQRRQILSALPTLAQLIKDSVQKRSLDLELYGSREQRMRLREVIGETISEIGMIDLEAIHPTLIRLAADNNDTIQLAAAKVMARWRYFDRHDLLFDTLSRWQSDSQIQAVFEAVLGNDTTKEHESGRAYVEATIAITIGVAARYDKPNQLDPELIQLFRGLSHNTHRFVRTRFRNYTLPYMVRHHLAQLQPELRSMTRYVDLDWPIAESLAHTYRYHPEEVLKTLGQWYNECVQNRPSAPNPRKLTLRETLLATIALTYGEIDYSAPNSPLTFNEAFQPLLKILNDEAHPRVRTAVVLAVGSLAQRHFEQVEQDLHRLVRELPEHERQDIVTILQRIYSQQRAALEGNDWVSVHNQRYAIWYPTTTRPPTGVEQAMRRWLADTQNPIGQQIALWALTEFERQLDRAIDQAAAQQFEARLLAALNPASTLASTTLVGAPRSIGWYTQKIVPLLATLFEGSRYRAIIQSLLPEALERRRVDPAALQGMLMRLEHTPDQIIQPIGRYLRRALVIVDRGCVFQGILLLGLLLLLCFGPRLLLALLQGVF